MKIKNILSIILAAIFTFSLAACGGGNNGGGNNTVEVTGITLNKSTLNLIISDSETLIATISPDNATDKTVSWSSSAPSKATVSGGVVTAVAAGTAIITASCGEKSATCAVTVSPPPTPTSAITVDGGQIKGLYNATESVAIYKGIPYAAPPIGENRWKDPKDVVPWSGVKECYSWGNSAMQSAQNAFGAWTAEFIIENKEYSEDCLTLNVWAKNDDVADKPVLFYIHGGAYTSGGSSCEVYDGEYIASQGVVFVSINYRVGIFGWLATDALVAEGGSAGNYGLLDQIKALEWVNANIEKFNGDPENVTIMGQSAGAGSVNALMVSPLAEGLFKRCVSLSYNSLYSGLELLSNRLSDGNKLEKSLSELRAMSASQVSALGFGTSGPCVDGKTIEEQYGDALSNGVAKDIDLMTGMVENEANDDITGFIANMSLDRYMFGAESIEGKATYLESMMYMQNDIVLTRQDGQGSGKTYVYDFAKMMPGSPFYGAFHTSDVAYFLHNFSAKRNAFWTADDYTVGNTASSYLINFCKTGDPNGTGLVTWAPSSGDYSYFRIDTQCERRIMTKTTIDALIEYFS